MEVAKALAGVAGGVMILLARLVRATFRSVLGSWSKVRRRSICLSGHGGRFEGADQRCSGAEVCIRVGGGSGVGRRGASMIDDLGGWQPCGDSHAAET